MNQTYPASSSSSLAQALADSPARKSVRHAPVRITLVNRTNHRPMSQVFFQAEFMTALLHAEEVTIYFRCAAIGFATRKNHNVIATHESSSGQCHGHEGAVFGGARRGA